MGVLGSALIILLIVYFIITGLRVYKNGTNEIKFLCMITLLGLITYFTHGFLNNFLDTDKLSVPVWGFIAIIVALDIYHKPKDNPSSIDG